jgi:hypothetical protein
MRTGWLQGRVELRSPASGRMILGYATSLPRS